MRLIKILLILILVFRINLFTLPGFAVDINGWKAWSYKLAQSGPAEFYSKDYFSDYFPGYLYILWGTGSLFNAFSVPINSMLFEFFIKFITSLFDLGSAFYIFKIVSKYNKKWSYFAPVLYLANPATFFNSSVWGQVDGIFTFFLLMSAFFLFEKKKIYKSTTALTIGFLTKPHSLAFLPVFLVELFKNSQRDKIIKSAFLGLVVFLILSFPFFPKNPLTGIIELGSNAQNVYPFTSLFAFNFWGIVGVWKPDSSLFLFASYKTWGVILYLASLVLITIPLIRKKTEIKQLYFAASLSFLTFFLLLTRMHERYLFPFIAFMLIVAFVYKSRALFSIWILVSLVHFINLWFVYYYYRFVYNDSKFASNFFFSFVNDNFKYFSILMIALFAVLLVKYYKYVKKS